MPFRPSGRGQVSVRRAFNNSNRIITLLNLTAMTRNSDHLHDLYLMLSPGHESLRIALCDEGSEGFRKFIGKSVDMALKTPMVPDN